MDKTCSLDTLAQFLNLSKRRIMQLAQEGILLRPMKRGQYFYVKCAQAYIKYLRNLNSGHDSSLSEERRKDLRESYLLKKKKREILDNKYVYIEIAAKILAIAIRPFKASLSAYPAKVAPALECKCKKDIDKILTKFVHRELTELAGLDAAYFVAELKAQAGGAPAPPERKRVGGLKKKVKPRKQQRGRPKNSRGNL